MRDDVEMESEAEAEIEEECGRRQDGRMWYRRCAQQTTAPEGGSCSGT